MKINCSSQMPAYAGSSSLEKTSSAHCWCFRCLICPGAQMLQDPDLTFKWSDCSNFKHANLVIQQWKTVNPNFNESSMHRLERSQEIWTSQSLFIFDVTVNHFVCWLNKQIRRASFKRSGWTPVFACFQRQKLLRHWILCLRAQNLRHINFLTAGPKQIL